MLQHVDADHGVETGIAIGQSLSHTDIVADLASGLGGMGARGGNGIGGRIYACHPRAAIVQRFGHEPARAAKVKHLATGPIELPIHPGQPSGHQIFQGTHPADVVRPPAIGYLVIDCQIVAHRASFVSIQARHKAPQRGTERNARHSGRQIGVPSGAGPAGSRRYS